MRLGGTLLWMGRLEKSSESELWVRRYPLRLRGRVYAVFMGSWGTAIFSDDVDADVRADWRKGILDKIPSEELTAKLQNSHAAQADDPNEGVVFWLALAAAQYETGRLRPDVRDTALDILNRGGDVARWEEEDP